MSRTLVIGDIHGAVKALEQVLDRSNFDIKTDQLIQLGDIADGWPQTAECVEIFLSIQHNSTEKNKPIFIRGNHDVWVYDWFNLGIAPHLWVQQGGQATIDSYFTNELLGNDKHRNFWNKQVDWYRDDQNRLFIHAGWDYLLNFPAGAQSKINAGTIARECHWNRSLIESARAVFSKKFKNPRLKTLEQFKEVYIGHTAIHGKNPKPEQLNNLWNLDTGCGWDGVLTIMDINTKQYWQSDRSADLYPKQSGIR